MRRYTPHTLAGLVLGVLIYAGGWYVALGRADYGTAAGLFVVAGGVWFASLDPQWGDVYR